MCLILRASLLLALLSFASIAVARERVTIFSPSRGAKITGTTVQVRIGVGNFAIVPSDVPLSAAGTRPDLNQSGQGVVALRLDLLPTVILTNTTTFTFTNIPSGDHRLEVELTNIDHSSFTPRVMEAVGFQTVIPAVPATAIVSATAMPPSTPATTITLRSAPHHVESQNEPVTATTLGSVSYRFGFQNKSAPTTTLRAMSNEQVRQPALTPQPALAQQQSESMATNEITPKRVATSSSPTAAKATPYTIFQKLLGTVATVVNDMSDTERALILLVLFLIAICDFVLLVCGQIIAYTDEVCWRLRSLKRYWV